jgi:hypothetical protein
MLSAQNVLMLGIGTGQVDFDECLYEDLQLNVHAADHILISEG